MDLNNTFFLSLTKTRLHLVICIFTQSGLTIFVVAGHVAVEGVARVECLVASFAAVAAEGGEMFRLEVALAGEPVPRRQCVVLYGSGTESNYSKAKTKFWGKFLFSTQKVGKFIFCFQPIKYGRYFIKQRTYVWYNFKK